MNLSAREITGVFLSPLVIPLFGLVAGGYDEADSWEWLGIASMVGFSYLGMVVFGIPAILSLKKHGKLLLGWLVIAGMMGGAFIWLVFIALLSWWLESTSVVSPLTVFGGAMLGAFVAITYGIIAGVRVSGKAI
jgi:hypothetical protein